MTILNMVGWWASWPKVPLNAISVISAVWWDEEATITWTDPSDLVVNWVTVTTWSSTKLVRKAGSAPANINDWTLVLTETIRDTYSSTWYTDTWLTNGTTYYYAAFAIADNWLVTISSTIPDVTPVQWRIPAAYQEVEYIASSGTQYINTWYEVQSNYKLETLVYVLTTGGDNVLYGTTRPSFTWGSPLCFTIGDHFIVWTWNSSVNISPVSFDVTHELTATLTSVILDNTTYSSSSYTTWGEELTLFGGNSYFGQVRIYYFKIYTWATLIRDLVPCYRKADTVIWMYDAVNNVFYTNAWTGIFTKWPDVN